MKSKQIKLKGNKQEQFIKIIASQFGVTSEAELNLIGVLCRLHMFQPFHMCKITRLNIMKETKLPYATLTTSIRRLVKSGVIARDSKSFYFNVSFRGLEDLDCIVFKME